MVFGFQRHDLHALVYKCRLSDFDDSKASVLGDYLPSRLSMDPEESVAGMVLPGDYSGALLFFFANGKAARVELSAYAIFLCVRHAQGLRCNFFEIPLPGQKDSHRIIRNLRALVKGDNLVLVDDGGLNGKAARVELSAYATTSNRRKLTGAYSDKSPLAALLFLHEDRELALYSNEPRALVFNTALLSPKSTRTVEYSQHLEVL